ncbi:AMP-binding protein [Nonomuraea endophytica]|uniref:Acyl-CoA synthetase (AMP-forming)/AMP-acid ligase II n=1 Tax=Nonomuraea endophytica TaxID=714136 RepID=A0A7W8A120_9ACTN|nr:AMP-binding protein [Nonomuraea endophytica]MBB5076791.1 acyl-CoA synthetase (AMP-forming)/AMP-acid ligase II [Nonomuraea endophytica]
MKPIVSSAGTVTNEVFGRAYERGDRPALVDLHGGLVYSYRRLVTEVTRAASGMVRRGARREQVVGVHVSTACAQTLAVHTVLAAGGVAAPLDPRLSGAELAERLSECDARTLITTPDLAPLSLRAVEESRVRQVIAFGSVVDTIDFEDLLTLEPTPLPTIDARLQDALVLSGGRRMAQSELLARMAELDEQVKLTESDVVLATWKPDDGCDLIALVGLAVLSGALVVAAATSDAADLPGTKHDFGVTVVAGAGGGFERL